MDSSVGSVVIQKIPVYKHVDGFYQKVETVEVERQSSYLEFIDVPFIRSTDEDGSRVLCGLCAAPMSYSKDNMKRHAKSHFRNKSENAVFCNVCQKDAGVGPGSVTSHKAGNHHQKTNKNKTMVHCHAHLQPNCKCETCELVPFSTIAERLELPCVVEEPMSVEKVRAAIGTSNGASKQVDINVSPAAVSFVLLTGRIEKPGILISPPVCDGCADVQNISAKKITSGLSVEEVEQLCYVCARRKELMPEQFASFVGKQVRVYRVSKNLMLSTYPSAGDTIELQDVIDLDAFGKLPSHIQILYDMTVDPVYTKPTFTLKDKSRKVAPSKAADTPQTSYEEPTGTSGAPDNQQSHDEAEASVEVEAIQANEASTISASPESGSNRHNKQRHVRQVSPSQAKNVSDASA